VRCRGRGERARQEDARGSGGCGERKGDHERGGGGTVSLCTATIDA
jgi:hypothetical protein